MDGQHPQPQPTMWPAAVAVGVAVLLVGLIISPLVIAPLGAAVALGALAFWVRGNRRASRPGKPAPPPPTPAPSAEGYEERFPRSRMLERATLGLGALIGLAVTVPAAGLALVPSLLGQRGRPIDLGPVKNFPEGEFVVATFLSDPRAGEVSRRAAYVRNNGLLGSLPSFTIMSSRCTHVGCPTQPNGPLFFKRRRSVKTSAGEVGFVPTQPSGFGCPCHGSQFDAEGNRTAGPAPRALDRYEFSIRNGRLLLGRLFSVSRVDGAGSTAQIHGYSLQGAGQPVDGIESWLYPVSPPS